MWRRLAHSALPGAAIAILIDLHLAVVLLAVASAIVLAMFYLERRDSLPPDA